ncbi:MAG: hypothetical protein COC22_01225 [Flavobacteriaceae bacterium]|nr:MAG: hypothetical protein COC22_01225 [Flavobacteriaceae bacterium]
MKKEIIFLFLIWNSVVCQQNFSQEVPSFQHKLEVLVLKKAEVLANEKEALKKEVIAIKKKLEQEEISVEEADKLKKEAAQFHALNIDNRLAIIENSISLLKRNNENKLDKTDDYSIASIEIGGKGGFLTIDNKRSRHQHDIKTYSNLVVAFGLNNTITEGQNLNDSPYKVGGSRFFEIGWAWDTRVFKNTNAVRFKYGMSFQYNGLKPKNNRYFVEDGNQTILKEFSDNLDKSKFRMTNLVFPIYFEFGPSKKIEKENSFRYSTKNKFKIGVGGYGGFNIGNLQKLKYKQGGSKVKEKSRIDYNTNNFVYGISAYIGKDDTSFYIKYDLNPIFKNATINQNNISFGVRFDL